MNEIKSRFSLILTKEEMDRLSFKMMKDGGIEVVANVHGLKVYQAKRFINNIINIAKTSIKMDVIHGYNHGTAIKDMIKNNIGNSKVYDIIQDQKNLGVTHIFAA